MHFFFFLQDDDGHLNLSRITTILPVENSLWVGTGDGYLIVYDLVMRHDNHLASQSASIRHNSAPCLSEGEPCGLDEAALREVRDRVKQLIQDWETADRRRKDWHQQKAGSKRHKKLHLDSGPDTSCGNSSSPVGLATVTETRGTLGRTKIERLSRCSPEEKPEAQPVRTLLNGCISDDDEGPRDNLHICEKANDELEENCKFTQRVIEVDLNHGTEGQCQGDMLDGGMPPHKKERFKGRGKDSRSTGLGKHILSAGTINPLHTLGDGDYSTLTDTIAPSEGHKRPNPTIHITPGAAAETDENIGGHLTIYVSNDTTNKSVSNGESVLAQVLKRAQEKHVLPPAESMVTGETTLTSGKETSFAQTLSPVAESAEEPEPEIRCHSNGHVMGVMKTFSHRQANLSIVMDDNVLQAPGLSPISECSESVSGGNSSPGYVSDTRPDNQSSSDSPWRCLSPASSLMSGSENNLSNLSNLSDSVSFHLHCDSQETEGEVRVPVAPSNSPDVPRADLLHPSQYEDVFTDGSTEKGWVRRGHTRSSSNASTEGLPSYELTLAAKIKISDKPIRCLVLTM